MILKCTCGRIKRGPQQPFRSTMTKTWVCPDCRVLMVRTTTILRQTIPSIKVISFESKRSVIGGVNGILSRLLGKTA